MTAADYHGRANYVINWCARLRISDYTDDTTCIGGDIWLPTRG
jgi:hypothetical protein